MWEQYKRTFAGMQAFIFLAALCIVIWTQRVYVASAFFSAMQLGAVFGAMWGARLKRLTRAGLAAAGGAKNALR